MTGRALPFAEFVVLIALMFSMIAFGTDAMLPALPRIAGDLGLSDVNRAQLVITSFILGTGLGQLLTGPLSDSLGRKPVITGGLLFFMLGCVLAMQAPTLGWMLVARIMQGIGVSAPRTVTLAMVRDQYAGRLMARVMSIAMVLFVLVPAVAPLIGQSIAHSFGWRAIFLSFILFALVGAFWLNLRQPETLAPERRRPLRAATYGAAAREVLGSRVVMTYTLVLGAGLGALFGYLSSAQQIYVETFGAGTDFPFYFAAIALVSGSSGFVNALLVMRLGMRLLAIIAISGLLVVSVAFALILWKGDLGPDALFRLFLLWSVITFFAPGLTFGNLNALAMEPMGHVAGMASAIVGAVGTMLGAAIAVPIGLAFDGTPMPLAIGFIVCSAASLALMLSNPKPPGGSSLRIAQAPPDRARSNTPP
ncbi:MAG: multidrug effflux MFS transporter [Paracoccaceae bacterium]